MNRQKSRQTFNDGLLDVYELCNIAFSGEMPEEGMRHKIKLAYHERTVGMQRFYAAHAVQTKIDMLVRVHERREITDRDVVVLRDGLQYDIVQIQLIEGAMPPVMDLSLRRRSKLLKVEGLP